MKKSIINSYKKRTIRKYIILLLCLIASNIAYSQQVGINTQTPTTTLDIVGSGDFEYLPLKMSPISGNIINKASQVNYNNSSPLYIDDKGYAFTAFSPVKTMIVDVRALGLTTSWQTLYTLPNATSVVDLAFFTNFAFGGGNVSLIYGRMMVGYGTSINIYAYSSTSLPSTITGNLSTVVTVAFNSTGSDLRFQLTSDNQLQVMKTVASSTASNLFILDSTVTSM